MQEQETSTKKFQKEMSAGIVALVLLNIVAKSQKPLYGYQIARLLDERSAQAPLMNQGTLYPVLRSLEKNGFLESMVEPSVSGPPRRYYSITDEGRKNLMLWIEIWEQTKKFVDAVIEGD